MNLMAHLVWAIIIIVLWYTSLFRRKFLSMALDLRPNGLRSIDNHSHMPYINRKLKLQRIYLNMNMFVEYAYMKLYGTKTQKNPKKIKFCAVLRCYQFCRVTDFAAHWNHQIRPFLVWAYDISIWHMTYDTFFWCHMSYRYDTPNVTKIHSLYGLVTYDIWHVILFVIISILQNNFQL
jgi:hypothetical protein